MGRRWSSSNKKILEISGSSSLVGAAGIASSPEGTGLPNIWPRVSKVLLFCSAIFTLLHRASDRPV